MNKILVIGSVRSTLITIQYLVKYNFEIVGILGYEPKSTINVSGWADLRTFSEESGLPFKGFIRINDNENLSWGYEKKPDIIFAIGFSQLLSEKWLKLPRIGCIGFHPTVLPKGRGRAPIAWIVLEQSKGSATYFLMGNGADDGPIFVQETFELSSSDDAKSVESKIEKAICTSLDRWLPDLKKGIWDPITQNHNDASYYGKRAPEDGIIFWNESAINVDRLIKASSYPHPGAYTYFNDQKLIIWESEIEVELPIKGVVGRVLQKDENKGFLVQCGNGLIWLKNIQASDDLNLKVGDKLGYNLEDEIFKLKSVFKKLNL